GRGGPGRPAPRLRAREGPGRLLHPDASRWRAVRGPGEGRAVPRRARGGRRRLVALHRQLILMATAIVATVGAANANSYVSEAEADTYFGDRLNATAWT